MLKNAIYALSFFAIASQTLASEFASPAFDCDKAYERAERIICSFEDLSILDQELAKKLQVERANPEASASAQAVWVENVRNRCGNSQCLKDVYRKRLAALDSYPTGTQLIAALEKTHTSANPSAPSISLQGESKQVVAESVTSATGPTSSDEPQKESQSANDKQPTKSDADVFSKLGDWVKSTIFWLLLLSITAVLFMVALRLWRTMPVAAPSGSTQHRRRTSDAHSASNKAPVSAGKEPRKIGDARPKGDRVWIYDSNDKVITNVHGTLENWTSDFVVISRSISGSKYRNFLKYNAEGRVVKQYSG